MLLSIEQQIRLIIVSCISGVVVGVMFDLYRIYRNNNCYNKYIVMLQDVVFWVVCSIVIFFITLLLNDAYIGFYGYAIMILSFFLYLSTISKLISKICLKMFILVGFIVRSVFKCLIYPFYVLAGESINKNTHNNINKRLEKK